MPPSHPEIESTKLDRSELRRLRRETRRPRYGELEVAFATAIALQISTVILERSGAC